MSINLNQFFRSKLIKPSTTIRELIEAAKGDRVARIEISTSDLERVLKWALETGFAATYGSCYIPLIDPGMETWSTSSEQTTHSNRDACISVFLGIKQSLVDDACYADETNNHDLLGQMLGIPECCRQTFTNRIKRVDFRRDPLLWLTWSEQDYMTSRCFPNPLARYFSAGLISHYPCSLSCEASLSLALKNFCYLQSYFPHVAQVLTRYENCAGLYIEGLGVAIFPSFKWYGNHFRFNFNSARIQGLKLRTLLKNCDGCCLLSSSHILFTKKNSIFGEICGCEVRVGNFFLPNNSQLLDQNPDKESTSKNNYVKKTR